MSALELETPRGVRAEYRVTWAGIVHERDTALVGERSADVLTLVTCWPFDAIRPGGPWRYIVVAERGVKKVPGTFLTGQRATHVRSAAGR